MSRTWIRMTGVWFWALVKLPTIAWGDEGASSILPEAALSESAAFGELQGEHAMATSPTLLDAEIVEDPEGFYGLRLRTEGPKRFTWRILETGLDDSGGRIRVHLPGGTISEVSTPSCWSATMEVTGSDESSVAGMIGLRGWLNPIGADWNGLDFGLTLSPRAGMTSTADSGGGIDLTWVFRGCVASNSDEYVELDDGGLIFGFAWSAGEEPSPLDSVFVEIYGAVYQGTQFVGVGLDAFEVSVTPIPEPCTRSLLMVGLIFIARLHRGEGYEGVKTQRP